MSRSVLNLRRSNNNLYFLLVLGQSVTFPVDFWTVVKTACDIPRWFLDELFARFGKGVTYPVGIRASESRLGCAAGVFQPAAGRGP